MLVLVFQVYLGLHHNGGSPGGLAVNYSIISALSVSDRSVNLMATIAFSNLLGSLILCPELLEA